MSDHSIRAQVVQTMEDLKIPRSNWDFTYKAGKIVGVTVLYDGVPYNIKSFKRGRDIIKGLPEMIRYTLQEHRDGY